mgnify:CR=1 FL=1
MTVATRQRIEKRIVRRVVCDALAAGYALNVNNGGDGPELAEPTTVRKTILGEMFATDDEHLLFYKDGKRVGWVYFVYGNGVDVVSDNTTNLEDVLRGAKELADQL